MRRGGGGTKMRGMHERQDGGKMKRCGGCDGNSEQQREMRRMDEE